MTPRNTRHRPAKPTTNGKVELKQLLMTMGRTGLKNLGGRIQEEYLQALKSWSLQSKIFIEMGDDSMIGTLLTAIRLPLLRADFDVTVASESDVDKEARDFLWANMTKMKRQTWRSHVKDQLDALQFGFAIGEVVLGGRPDGRFWIENIDPRGQETLYRWGFDEHDTATHFVQRDPDTGRELHIPLDKCIHYSFDGRKGNPQGRSLLRSLFRDWRFMRDFQDMEAIGVERDVGGACRS